MSEYIGVMMADIVDVIGAHYGVSLVALRSRRRTNDLVEPRHVACYVGSKITEHTLPQIGAFLRRDHTSIIHGRDKIAQAIRVDKELADRVMAIEVAALAMAQLRRENQLSRVEPLTPLELARTISDQGARAACGVSVNQILELCDSLIEASNLPPRPLPLSRYLIADLVMRQSFFRERPTLSNRLARDSVVELLKDPDRQSDTFVSAIVAAFDAMRRGEFTMAEKNATQKFNSVVRRAEIWLEKYALASGESQ